MSSNLRGQFTSSAIATSNKRQIHNKQDIEIDIEQQQFTKQQQKQHHQGAADNCAVGGGGGSDDSSSARRRSLDSKSIISSAEPVLVTSLQVNSKTSPDQNVSSKAKVPYKQSSSAAEAAEAAAATATTTASAYRQKRVLDPSGSVYYHWSMVVSVAFLYNFWSLSYRFAFREIDSESMLSWFALDYSADFIYFIDIVINSRTGYLEDGVLQQNFAKVRQHYSESTLFYLDGLCLLPLDILYLSFGFNSIFRFFRLVKIYKFWSYVDRTERHTNYPNVFRTVTLVHYILVIFHWNACLFHMISKNKLIDIESLYKINDNQCHDILCQYLHAFYWSTLALTTIGDLPRPRTKGEYIYVTVELFFGLFLFASVLGHVANIVTNVSAARKEFQAKLDAVKTFMRMRRVSDELQNKVIRWFDYLWISQQSSDEDKSVACLPDRLKAEIAIHVHLDTLKRVDIFQNTEAGFLCELVLRLKPVLFSPGDYVCRKNEVGHEMYIVSRGILEVVTDEGKVVVATLKAGSYFGEISVLNVGLAGNKRTASVRSVGYSDLFCLNKRDLWDVLKNYPNAEARIRARAEERLSKLDINSSSHGRRRSSGERRSSGSHFNSTATKPNSRSQQLDQQQQQQLALPPPHSKGFHPQSASCGCFVANAKGGFSSMSNNNGCLMERRSSSNRPECVCRRCVADSTTSPNYNNNNSSKIETASVARPRMPFTRCHKSRQASLNSSGRRVIGMQHGSRKQPESSSCFVCIHQDNDNDEEDDDYDYDELADADNQAELEFGSAPQCRSVVADCRHHPPASDWLSPHELVSYSRSFDQSTCRPTKSHNRDNDDVAIAAENSDSNSSPADDDNLVVHDSNRRGAARRFCRARRSSSAEPPLDADRWRELRRAAAATEPNSSTRTSQRRARPRGQPRREASESLDEDRRCPNKQEAAKRHHWHHGGRDSGRQRAHRLAANDHWAATAAAAASVEQGQPFVGQQLPRYWLLQQQPTLVAAPAANQAVTAAFVQVPGPVAAAAVTPDSQQSSTALFGHLTASGGCAVDSQSGAQQQQQPQPSTVRAQSMSTMFLNLQPPSFVQHHQAALLSPALPSPGLLHQGSSLYFELPQAAAAEQHRVASSFSSSSSAAAAAAAADQPGGKQTVIQPAAKADERDPVGAAMAAHPSRREQEERGESAHESKVDSGGQRG